MRSRIRFFAIFALAISFGASNLLAANYTFSTTVDPSNLTTNFSYFFGGTLPAFNLNAGDTISGTISFTGSQFLNVQVSPTTTNYIDIGFSAANNTTSAFYSASLNFLNFSGIGQSSASDQYSGGVASTIVEPAGSKYSFSGFSYSILITSIPANTLVQPSYIGDYLASDQRPRFPMILNSLPSRPRSRCFRSA